MKKTGFWLTHFCKFVVVCVGHANVLDRCTLGYFMLGDGHHDVANFKSHQ